MQLRTCAIAALLVACDPAALLDARSGSTPSEQNQQLAELQRDGQRRQIEQFQATQRADREESAKREAADKEKSDASARKATEQAEEQAKSHRDECAATYHTRFIQLQKDAAEFVATKPRITARCKALAKHCSTSSSGQSYCHGLTGEEHQAFDQWCSGTVVPLTRPDSEECSDVDPEHLAFDFSWSIEDALSLSKRKPPAAVTTTTLTAADSSPRTR